ncbi:MAG: SpoIIE family protein phosphatase [Phycisphaerae bacterium]|nr:SpoIIE family protein phosphatase [Phycisphaerae bacterium]
MRLIVLQSEAMIADVVCGTEAIYVGSGEGCRVQLTDARIAARQIVVYPERKGSWMLDQLESACEVSVNGTHISDKAELKTGDQIQILDYTIRVYPDYEEQPTAQTAVGTSRAQLERFAQARLPVGATLKKADEQVTLHPEQLAAIGRACVSVSGWATVEEFMDSALQTLLVTFAAQRAWMGVRRVSYGSLEYVEGRLITGQSTDMPEIGSDLKPRVLDRAQFILVPLLKAGERVSILSGPLVGPDGTLGMVYIDSGETGRRFDLRDMDFFALLLNIFAYQLDAIFKTLARSRAAMIEGQVGVAHEAQARLTPRMLPQSEQLQFGAFREPGRERSGDIYDVVRIANNLVSLMVAQTPATGAMPALLMTQAQTSFRSAAMHQDAPNVFLRWLNWLLYDGQKDHPLHCFTGLIDPASGQVRYALAGHVGAFIVSARGEERPLAPPEPTEPLGFVKNSVYPALSAQLEPGETLVVFTPGVTTAKNRREETFGEERFVNILCDGFGQLASATLKEMLTDLRTFTEGGSQPDDITVLLAHRV